MEKAPLMRPKPTPATVMTQRGCDTPRSQSLPPQAPPRPQETQPLLPCAALTICHLLDGDGGAAVLAEGHQPLNGLPAGDSVMGHHMAPWMDGTQDWGLFCTNPRLS